MSVRLNWLTVSEVRFDVAERGEEMGDGRSVESPCALTIDEGDEPILIEGKRSSLAAALKPAMRKLEPYRHEDLTSLVNRTRAMSGRANEVDRLKEALDVALTILGREDLR